MLNSLLLILLLIIISAFFSISEISLAASRRIKLKQMADEGNSKANLVMRLQEKPGLFFTVVQIGINAVAVLAGILGESTFAPQISQFLSSLMSTSLAQQLGSVLSFSFVTGVFILFADLMPKRIAMTMPEQVAITVIHPIRFSIYIFRPLVWFFNSLADLIFRLFHIPIVRNESLTMDDIYAVFEAGALSGALRKQEHELIENVFELDSRTVTSAMTVREDVIYFDLNEQNDDIKSKIVTTPHSKFLICDDSIDHVVGYVESKELLNRVVNEQSLTLKDGVQIHSILMIPNTLTLSEMLDRFKSTGEDLAVILNEYALVVGIITMKDVMTTLMGDIINWGQEEQIVVRDENSWLIDGTTPIDDVMHVLSIDEFPHSDNYETIGGFMMYILRKIPKRTDSVTHAGYKFEVVDIDNNKIDQLLVSHIEKTAEHEAQEELLKQEEQGKQDEE